MHLGQESSTFSASDPSSQIPADKSFTMDAVDLDTPMSTLRNIASLSKDIVSESHSMTYNPIFPSITKEERQAFEHDPVSQGLLTMEEAQEAFNMSAESTSICKSLALIDQSTDSSQIAIPWHRFFVSRVSARQRTYVRRVLHFSCQCVQLELDFGRPPTSMSTIFSDEPITLNSFSTVKQITKACMENIMP